MPANKLDNDIEHSDLSVMCKLTDLDISTMLNELRAQVTLLEDHNTSNIAKDTMPECVMAQQFTKKNGFSI